MYSKCACVHKNIHIYVYITTLKRKSYQLASGRHERGLKKCSWEGMKGGKEEQK